MSEKTDHIGIGVLVVSSRSLVRRGIISALADEGNIRILGEASNRLELLENIDKLRPGIVIVNDDREMNSLETIRLITQKHTDLKILLLIKDYNEDKELEALKMGVRGFLPERAIRADFIRCINAIDKGEMWIRRKVMEKLIQQLWVINPPQRQSSLSSSAPSLTERELEIMIMVSNGYTNKEIGEDLHISERTVKGTLSKIFKKLGIKSRTDIRQHLKSYL
ncbi:MAG TPA: response regulator transcription factor [Thermodesulfobacteriota bacterium]|nr:response regulator transcription factor [Thermodesulfobacteriota bacterium]